MKKLFVRVHGWPKRFPIAIFLVVGFVLWATWALRERSMVLTPPVIQEEPSKDQAVAGVWAGDRGGVGPRDGSDAKAQSAFLVSDADVQESGWPVPPIGLAGASGSGRGLRHSNSVVGS